VTFSHPQQSSRSFIIVDEENLLCFQSSSQHQRLSMFKTFRAGELLFRLKLGLGIFGKQHRGEKASEAIFEPQQERA